MAELRQQTGSRIAWIFGNEATWAEPDTVSRWRRFPVIGGEGMDQNIRTYQTETIHSDREESPDNLGTEDAGGNMPFELNVDQMFLFWHAFGGEVDTTGSGTFTHTIETHPDITGEGSGTPIGMTIEKQFLYLDGAKKYIAWRGCRVNGLAIDCQIDRYINTSADLVGEGMHEASGSIWRTASLNAGDLPDDSLLDPFRCIQATLTIDGYPIDLLQAFTWNISNNFYRDRSYEISGTRRRSLPPGRRLINGTLDIGFTEPDWYETAVSGDTDLELEIEFSNGTHSLNLLHPRIRLYPNGSIPKQLDDGPMAHQLVWKAHRGDTPVCTATIVSPVDDLTD